jgi:hypothetical protein
MLLFLFYNWGSKEVLPLIEGGGGPQQQMVPKEELIMGQ